MNTNQNTNFVKTETGWSRFWSRLLPASKHDLKESIKLMNAAMQALADEVAKVKTVEQSAITLINGLSQQIKDAGTDPVALAAITADLDSSSASLAAAVTAATPAPATTEAPAGQ